MNALRRLASLAALGALALAFALPAAAQVRGGRSGINGIPQNLQLTTINGVAPSDWARLSIPNTLQGTLTLAKSPSSSLDGGALIFNNIPMLAWYETAGAVDNRLWDCIAFLESFRCRTAGDSGGGNVNWLRVERTGTALDSINMAAVTTLISSTGGGGIALNVQGGSGEVLRVAGTNPYIGMFPSGGTANWAIQAGSAASQFRVYDLTAGAERFAISGTGVLSQGASQSRIPLMAAGSIAHATDTLNAGATNISAASRTGVGTYSVTFSPAFGASPVCTASDSTAGQAANVDSIGTGGATVRVFTSSTGATLDPASGSVSLTCMGQ